MSTKKVSLTKVQRSEINRLLKSSHIPKGLNNRFQCLLLLEKGFSPTYISRELTVARYTIYRWKKRFQEEGLIGLLDESNFSQEQVFPALIQSSSKRKASTIFSPSTLRRIRRGYQSQPISLLSENQQQTTTAKPQKKITQNSPSNQVTHQDIAQKAKVSASTVSLALSNSNRIPQRTKDKILLWASRLGYRRKAGLHHLASLRWQGHSKPLSLALLTCNKLTHPIFPYFKNKAKELDYSLEIFQLEMYPDYKKLSRILYQRGVQGIIIFSVKSQIEPLRKHIDWRHFSVISFGQRGAISNSVTYAYTLSTEQACKKVWDLGYRRIGAAVPRNRRDIFTEIFTSQHEMLPFSQHIPIFDLEPQEHPHQFQTWLKKYKPDVLLSTFHYFPGLLYDLGYRVPEDIAFLSLTLPFYGQKNISGVNLNYKLLCQKVLESLDTQIRLNQLGLPKEKIKITIPTQWNEGKTLPKKL